MNPADHRRRVSAEVSWRTNPWAVAWVGRRTIYHFWPVLAPYFRDVFLPPHRRAEEEGVAWNWSERDDQPPITAGELATVRRRLSGDRDAFADFLADGRHTIEQDSVEQLDHVVAQIVRQLVAKSDAELASFACRGEAGVRLHSWGASEAAPLRYPGDNDEPAPVEARAPRREPRTAPVATARPAWVKRAIIAALALLGVAAGVRFFKRSAVVDTPAGEIAAAKSAKLSPVESAPVARERPDTLPARADAQTRAGGGGVGAGAGAGSRSSRPPRPVAALPPAEHDRILLPPGSTGGGSAVGSSEVEHDIAVPANRGKPGASAHASAGAPVGAATASTAAGQGGSPGGMAGGASASGNGEAPNPIASQAASASPAPAASVQPAQRRSRRERANADLAREPSTEEAAPQPAKTAVATDSEPARIATQALPDQRIAPEPPRSSAAAAKILSAGVAGTGARAAEADSAAADAESTSRTRSARKRRSTPDAGEPGASTADASRRVGAPGMAAAAPEMRLNRVVTFSLSPWRPQLIADTIVPTTPVPIGRAQSLAAMRESMMADKLAQLPAAFRRPAILCGFVLNVRAAEGGLSWQQAEGPGESAATQVRAERAEIRWPADRPPVGARSVLRNAAGAIVAEVRFDPSSGPTLRASEDVGIAAWIALRDETAQAARFEWQSASGLAFASNQQARDDTGHTLTLPLTGVSGGSLPRGIALADRESGWALAAELELRHR